MPGPPYRIYLDESLSGRWLVALFRAAGCEVITPADSGLLCRSDQEQFAYALEHDLILITANPPDFKTIHEQADRKPTILAVYQDGDKRDMSYQEIVEAFLNLVSFPGLDITGQFIRLNDYRTPRSR